MDQRNPTFNRFANKVKVPKGSVLRYIKNQGYIAAPRPATRPAVAPPAAAAAVAPQKPFDPAAALGNEGIYAGESAQIKADNEVAQKQRDNAVKALQFQFNDPSNPFSQVGEMQRALKETKGNFSANRGARGVATSGGSTLGQMEIGHNYSKGLYDATNQLNGQIGTLDNSLAETLRENAARQATALGSATGRLIDNGVGLGTDMAGAGQIGPNGQIIDPTKPGYGGSPVPAPAPGSIGAPPPQVGAAGGYAGPVGSSTPWNPAQGSFAAFQAKQEQANAADRALHPQNWVKEANGTYSDLRTSNQEVRDQAKWNAQGYQTMFLGTPEATVRKLPPGVKYTDEMHMQDLHRTGRDRPGWDGRDSAGRPLPGAANAAKRRKAAIWAAGRIS